MRKRRYLLLATLAFTARALSADVTGRVISPEAAPFGGAAVAAYAKEPADARSARLLAGRARAPLAMTRSAKDGSFRLATGSALVDLAVQADGFAPHFAPVLDGVPVTVALRQARSLKGRVTAGGRPVAGAMVAFTSGDAFDNPAGEVIVRSGADGSYEVPDPETWATGLVVAHPDYALLDSSQGWAGHRMMTRGSSPLRLEVNAGVPVQGQVVDGAGRGLAGATLWLGAWPVGRSAADGSFLIPHAASGQGSVVARSQGLVGSAEAAEGRIVIRTEPGRALSGVVRDAKSREPLAGASVWVLGDRLGAPLAVLTDARGRYSVTSLPPGQYAAYVSRPGYAAGAGEQGESLDLRRSSSLAQDFALARLVRIRGRVLDETGKPVDLALLATGASGAQNVYAGSGVVGSDAATARSAPDGSFALDLPEQAPAGGIALLALKPGFAAGRYEPLKPEAFEGKGVVITLARGVEIRGRVSSVDGQAIPDVAIALAEDAAFAGDFPPIQILLGTFEGAAWTRSDAEGRFSTRVHPRVHHLAFRKSGHPPKVLRGFDARSGGSADVVLDPAADVRGRVQRSDGSGIPDLDVFAQQRPGSQTGSATTDGEGRFEIGDLAPGRYELSVTWSAAGLRETRSVEAPAPELRIEMGPTAAVRGHVVDARTDEPLRSFQVSLETAAPDDPATYHGSRRGQQVDDAEGAFVLDDVPLGQVTLTVRAPGYVAGRIEDLAVSGGADAPDLEIALEPGLTIRGRVSSEEGEALSEVRVSGSRRDHDGAAAQSDESGEYELRGLAPGSVSMEFRRDGFRSARRTVSTADTLRVDVTLSRGLAVSGVVTSDGVGVPDASVSASSSVADADSGSATTDEKGRFRIEGLAPGRYAIEAEADGVGEAELKDVDVERAGLLRLAIERPRTAVLTGRLVGLPPAGDAVSAMVVAENEDGRSEYATVEATGAFRMDKAPAGRVKVRATATAYSGGSRSSRTNELTLAPGSETETLLEFHDDFAIAGTVTSGGAPVAGAVVSFDPVGRGGGSAAPTGPEGGYEVVGLEAGPYRVGVAGNGLAYETAYSVVGSDRFDIDATGAALRGRTVDAADGSPIPGAEISLFRLGSGENRPTSSLKTDAAGEFASRSLAEGRYRLLASKDGFGQELREVELARGDTSEALFELRSSEGLSLKVVDDRDGRPLDAYVVVRDTARRIVANSHSGLEADGTLRISLAPGQYLLSTSASGYGTATLPVTAPGEGLRVGLTPGGTLVLESERDLHGRVRLVRADGEEYVRCWCNGISDITVKGHKTSVPNITPEAYTVVFVDDLGTSSEAGSVVIREGQTSTVAIE